MPYIRVPSTVEQFWQFVYERHSIWNRRWLLKQPPPWTKDPILAHYRFVNVYRELDKGTQWYVQNLAPKADGLPDLLWRTILYRLMNNIDFWDAVGYVPKYHLFYGDQQYRERFFAELRRLREEGELQYPNAHMSMPQPVHMASWIDRFEYICEQALFTYPQIVIYLQAQLKDGVGDFKDTWQKIQGMYGIGGFTAYEVCLDLMMVDMLPYDPDTWAHIGPGARLGLQYLFETRRIKQQLAYAQALRDVQPYCMEALGLDMHWWKGETLSLGNIIHSVCEFGKYVSHQHSKGRPRMNFDAEEAYEVPLFKVVAP